MWRNLRATSGLAALLVFGTAGCVDLAVNNPNAPDAARALRTAGDVEALISGAYSRWLYQMDYEGPSMFLSVAANQHSAPWANSGMEYYGRIPRVPTYNNPGAADVGNLVYAWTQSWRVLSAVHDGLHMIDSGVVDLKANTIRAQAFGKYMQGLAHGTLALLYDSSYIYDETMDPAAMKTAGKLYGYKDVMDAALGYLDQAATLASANTFTIPSSWMGSNVSSATLAKLAHSYAAIFRASVARTPTERKAVDWTKVVADANAGVTANWMRVFNCNTGLFCGNGGNLYNMLVDGWEMQSNWVLGMADTSGEYQAWVATALTDMQPFIIQTPDTRWPQGADEDAQRAAPGSMFIMQANDQGTWSRPDRGTWRWSYYAQPVEPWYTTYTIEGEGSVPEVRVEELAALKAEAAYYATDYAAVESFVNATRTLHGLNQTNSGTAAGVNTSCVPKLPSGACGDLWEMFKWEKRLETIFGGPLSVGFYFDARGWGDLIEGTFLQFPMPYRETQMLGRSPYDYGGIGGNFGAPISTYGW